MEKKYYNIIASLIEKNDKFIGCEPILDDIIKDVYEHSKIVLGSVSNEDVIMAYLNKVVATSLITVPKKLNFNIKNKHRVISNVQSITNINIQNPQKQPEPLQENIVLPAKKEQVTELEIEDLKKDNEVILSEDTEQKVEETFETISFEAEETPVQSSELLIEDELEQFLEPEQNEETLVFEEEHKLEDSLVAEEENIDIDNSNDQEEPASNAVLETIEIEESEPNDAITLELETEEINEIENIVEIEDVPFESTEESTLETEELIEETTSIDVVDKNLVDQMINGIPSKEEELENEPEQEVDSFDSVELGFDSTNEFMLEEESSEELLTFETEDETTSFDLSNEPNGIELKEETSALELSTPETVEADEVILPEKLELSEEILSYNDSDYSDDSEYLELLNKEVCTGLKEFNTKYPNKKHLEVCKLKYKENLSVSEIAESLNFTEEAVIEVLNDIIELVKD